MAYNEGNRYLYIETPLGDSKLLLQSFTGSEGLSQLFDFQLELLADNAATIDFNQLIGQKVSFGVLGGESGLVARDFNGIVVEFMQGLRDREFTAYRMRVAPEIWRLTKKFQSRIFQHITVPDILKQVLTGFDVSYEIQGTFEQREYCTQYRETDFDYLSRMMEEEGIYYFFKFTRGAHKLVLANTPPSHPDIPGDSKVIFETTSGGYRDEERITWWQKEQIWGPGKYTTWDHHFQLPHKHLPAEATSGITVQVGKVPHKLNLARNEELEIYDYPAAYAQRFDDINRSGGEQGTLPKVYPDAKRTDGIRIQQQETPTLAIQATSNCRQMTAGHKFTLQRHFNGDGKYVILRVSHDASEADFRSVQSQLYDHHYTNKFSCLPYELPFRPPRVTEKPVIAGPQTAVVVGPSGEEIFTDKYGRVKVQFHWDRAGKYDGDSSCWLRVGTLFAGKQWGSVFIPRIGHEVIVGFIEGDPDRPIVIGSVYNADTMPPYELPANKTRSGIKTDSSLGSGGFNEIRFEDLKGKEQIFIHGQKDSDTRIENDCREWIGEDRHLIVKRDKYEEVDRDLHIAIKHDHLEKIEGDRNLTVQGKEAIQISGTQSLQVTGNVAEQFGANHTEQTSGSYFLQAQSIVLEANTSICLTVGGSFISISAAGITILGMPMVNINSGGAAIPGIPGTPVSPVLPGAAMVADQAVAGSEVSYTADGEESSAGGGSAVAEPRKDGPAKPKNPCSGWGMSDDKKEKAFADGFKKLQKDWKTLTPDQRQARIKALANGATSAGVPEVGVHPKKMSDAGQLDFTNWRLDLNEDDLNKNEFSDAEAKEFADTVYHETRHGEQWYLIAQKRAAEGKTADEISSELSIPKSVAESAVKDPLGKKDPRQACADALFESVYGSKRDARNKTLTDLDTMGDAVTKAQQDYEKLDKTATAKQKDDAFKAWQKASADYEKVKKDYMNLPEEADAWETAGKMQKQW